MAMNSSDQKPPPDADPVIAAHAALAVGDAPEAIRIAKAALAEGVEAPLLLNLAAYDLELQGRLVEAMELLDRALRLAPADPAILNAIGRNHSKQGRAGEALRAFDAALAAHPTYAAAHNGRGLALAMMGHLDGAWAAQETAARLEPTFPDPLGAMASLALQRQDWPAARTHAERALALEPYQSAASVALAVLDQREGDYPAAAERMDALIRHGGLAPLHEATAQRLLADALDALDRPAEAFHASAAANRLLRHAHRSTFGREGVEGGTALTARLADYFTHAGADDWRPSGPSDKSGGATGHVFLVGFPNSGEGWLEQVLASHRGVVTLADQATLGDIGAHFFTDTALDELAALDAAAAERLRADYWARVRAFGVDPAGKLFVDRPPLGVLWLPYVAKLFPDAKVLLAGRDPRDVALDSFRSRFRVDGASYAFTDLEDLARFYAGTMAAAEIYREKLALPWRVQRLEDLVEDFDTEVEAIRAFLGVEQDAVMQDVAALAGPPAIGRWRTYADGLAPALPILQPLVDRYGYPAA